MWKQTRLIKLKRFLTHSKTNMRSLSYPPLAFLCGMALFLFAASVSAQTQLPDVTQAKMDAALQDLSDLYGSPVVRIDQAKAICNQEQYMVECARIGKEHGLFSKERAQQVDTLLSQIKGDMVAKLKQCGSVECLVEVATLLANRLAADNPALARTIDLTPQKVQEKRDIADIAKSAGVSIEECQTMDPDAASLELLRGCAKLAKNEKLQKYIPQEDRKKVERSDNTVALKEALENGELSCGDGTLDGCGDFCLNPSLESRREGSVEIPSVCREIATRFFGAQGVQELERAYGNVQQTFDVTKERYFRPEDRRGTSTPRLACPALERQPCPDGEYRQGSTNEFGCYAESACIPFNTKTRAEPNEERFLCPALASVDSCRDGEEKVVSFISPECGTYYTCKPAPKFDTRGKYPFTFASGRVVLSFEETRTYCYESGQNGATLRGDKTECGRVFGISVPETPPEKHCAQYGSGWRGIDASGNCFNTDMTEYLTQNGILRTCTDQPVYGCANKMQSPPGGQKEQVWNSKGLRSWVNINADSARVESLKQACSQVSGSGNVWMPDAGNASSIDFGMPDPSKCKASAACATGQYFDGTSCRQDGAAAPGAETGCRSAGGTWDYTTQYCRMPTTSPTSPWGPGGVSGSCSNELLSLLGSGCHSMGNGWFNSGMTSYVMPGGSVVRSCATEPISGCSGASQSGTNACTGGQYWNGSACVSSSSGGSSAGGMQRCFYPNATKNGQNVGYTVWCEADYVNCREGSPSGASISLTGLALGAPSSCESGWSGGSSGQPASGDGCPAGQYRSGGTSGTCVASPPSCTSGQYWNGSACVNTSTTDCTSGQYWNGSACVSSSDGNTSSAQSGCVSAGGTWDTSSNYCRMPSSGSTGSTSCGNGYTWNGTSCVTTCGTGQYWNGSACEAAPSGTSTSCPSGQYWSGTSGSCVSSSPASSGTDTSSMQSGCASAGGTWDSASNSCRMPTSYVGQTPLAFLCPKGHGWNGSYCTLAPPSQFESYTASVISAFRSLLFW